MKRVLLAIVSLWVLWSVMDIVIHGIILSSAYQATAQLWRPVEEMKTGLAHTVTLLMVIPFVLIFRLFVRQMDVKTGLLYGALYGFSVGMSLGYGSYSVMPIPYYMALTWFLGMMAEMVAGGAVIGWIFSEKAACEP